MRLTGSLTWVLGNAYDPLIKPGPWSLHEFGHWLAAGRLTHRKAAHRLRGVFVQPTFEPATPADVPVVLQMIGELADFEKLSKAAVGTAAALHEGLFGVTPKAEALLARLEGQVVGFALFFSNYSTFLCRPGLYLEDLYIRPAYRAQGIGRQFLQHIARLALERGRGRFEWSVLNWNESAIQFYQSMGARPVAGWTVYRLDQFALEAFRDTPA